MSGTDRTGCVRLNDSTFTKTYSRRAAKSAKELVPHSCHAELVSASSCLLQYFKINSKTIRVKKRNHELHKLHELQNIKLRSVNDKELKPLVIDYEDC